MVDRPAVPSMPVPPAPAVRNTVRGTDPAPMNTRMAVPRASAVSFWGNVGDDILFLLLGRYALGGGVDGSDLRLTRSADEAGVRGELRRQGRDGRVLVWAVGRQRDLGRRADRQTEQGDEALRIGLPSVLAADEP